jgi:hypothetical protein
MTTIFESYNMQLDASPNDEDHTYITDGHSARDKGSYESAAAPENCIAKV